MEFILVLFMSSECLFFVNLSKGERDILDMMGTSTLIPSDCVTGIFVSPGHPKKDTSAWLSDYLGMGTKVTQNNSQAGFCTVQ